jgi:predicted nucleotidyltransferase
VTVSEATRDLWALAQRIAAAYPEAPEQEIVVTGSVSRGVADKHSDLEILFSEAALRSEDEYAEFGRAAGVRVTDL